MVDCHFAVDLSFDVNVPNNAVLCLICKTIRKGWKIDCFELLIGQVTTGCESFEEF